MTFKEITHVVNMLRANNLLKLVRERYYNTDSNELVPTQICLNAFLVCYPLLLPIPETLYLQIYMHRGSLMNSKICANRVKARIGEFIHISNSMQIFPNNNKNGYNGNTNSIKPKYTNREKQSTNVCF